MIDLVELGRCSRLLCTAVLNLTVAVAFLVPKLGMAKEGVGWQELLIAIGLLRGGTLASFGKEKGGEVVTIGASSFSITNLIAVWLVLNKMSLLYAMLQSPQPMIIKIHMHTRPQVWRKMTSC